MPTIILFVPVRIALISIVVSLINSADWRFFSIQETRRAIMPWIQSKRCVKRFLIFVRSLL